MIRTDRKFRPVFVNEQNVIVFGLSEMKITRNMQFMHSQSSQGYYGAMNQKEMFGESISIKLELQEMQIHEVDFK